MLSLSAARSIGARLHLATIVAVAAVALLLGSLYVVEVGRIWEARKALLRSVVETAAGITAEFERKSRDGLVSCEAAQAAAAAAIQAMRYEGGN